jgi:hypothetical protein
MENLATGHVHVSIRSTGRREGLYIDIETVLIRFLGNEAWVLRLANGDRPSGRMVVNSFEEEHLS